MQKYFFLVTLFILQIFCQHFKIYKSEEKFLIKKLTHRLHKQKARSHLKYKLKHMKKFVSKFFEKKVKLHKDDEEHICFQAKVPHYEACKRINDCALCTASPHCGWCINESQQRCLPGGKALASCPNGPDFCAKEDFIFDIDMCEGIPLKQGATNLIEENQFRAAGAFTNMASDSRDFKTPEIANKNFAVTVSSGNLKSSFFVPMNGNQGNSYQFHGTNRNLRLKRHRLMKIRSILKNIK